MSTIFGRLKAIFPKPSYFPTRSPGDELGGNRQAVTIDSAPSAHPPSYPKNGTYADLLWWHMRIWGTRDGGNTVKPGRKWGPKEFSGRILPGYPADDAASNLKNWLGRASPPGSSDWIDRIEEALFGDTDNLQQWKIDFRWAHEKSRGTGKNKRTLTAKMLASGPGALSHDIFGAVHSGKNHFAAAARENVALVTHKLTEFFAGRSNDIQAIDRFVSSRMAGGAEGLLVITAPPGFGKSALAAHWCNRSVPNRRIASHFCAVSHGTTTTAPEHIFANLHQQVAEMLREPIDQSDSFDALAALLSRPPPEGEELVVWLDGIDEASDRVECFLPKKLGERVCVIISARADEGTIPAYLAPWLADAMAVSHRPLRQSLDKLTLADVGQIVSGLFAAEDLIPPLNLPWRIFNASDQGYALIVRNMAESAIHAVKEGQDVDLGGSSETLFGYAASELRRLESLEQWPDLQPLFAFLTIAREAVSVDELPRLIGKRVFPGTLPRQLMRWLSLVESPNRERPALLSFAHPLLTSMFGRALGHEREQALAGLCDNVTEQVFTQWPLYASRHLPQHLLEAGRAHQAITLLTDFAFISARFAALGAEGGPRLMASDWAAWFTSTRQGEQGPADSKPLQHLRFWNNFAARLINAAAAGSIDAWRQLMHDVGLNNTPAEAALTGKIRPNIPSSIATFWGHRSAVYGALKLENGAGFLSWGQDGTLRLWGAAGEERAVLLGHARAVFGALELANNAGFLSWSDDRTLRLWGRSGEERAILLGHEKAVEGAIVAEEGASFLSWSRDETLRLWCTEGNPRAVLRGHEGWVRGALALDDGGGFLSWSSDRTLRLWNADGENRSILRGHEGPIGGALVLGRGTNLLSWSEDCTLRLWKSGGDQCAVLRGHEGNIGGALVLEDGVSILSWSDDGTLRLWGPAGEEHAIMRGHERKINGALALNDGSGLLSWSDDGTIRVWGLNGEARAVSGNHGSIFNVMELDGSPGFISWGDTGSSIELLGPTGEECTTLTDHEDWISGVLALDSGEGLLSWSHDCTLRLWSLRSEQHRALTPNENRDRVQGAFAVRGRESFLFWNRDGSLHLSNAVDETHVLLDENKGSVVGALMLDDGAGFLSWDWDGILQLWGPDGEERAVLRGHKGPIKGALALKEGEGLLSWSDDRTLRLWSQDGEERAVLRGHENSIAGALALEGGAGLLSWDYEDSFRLWDLSGKARGMRSGFECSVEGALPLNDGAGFLAWNGSPTLRFWTWDGQLRARLFGHDEGVKGALALENEAGFLSWSSDGTLLLWSLQGDVLAVLHGHEGRVRGALALEGNAGFLSWGDDRKLRLWGLAGEDRGVLSGHELGVVGALAKKGGTGFISWGREGSLRLWDQRGKLQNLWLSPCGAITHVEPYGESGRYLVVFGGNVGIVRLKPKNGEPQPY